VSNLLSIYSALSGLTVEELEKDYSGKGYGDLKGDLADVVADVLTPFRERALGYLDDPAALDDVLAAGAEKARAVASATLEQAYDRVGFLRAARRTYR
jgi:tryptophanyl-tRNA synthetase